jgi:hypothetical protein
VLKPGGFAVEIGYDQSKAVEALFREAGAFNVHTLKDLSDARPRGRRGEKSLGNPGLNRYIKVSPPNLAGVAAV